MTRTLAAALLLTAVAAGVVVAGLSVQRDLRYQSLVAGGNRALATEQTFAAIEAFSGAIALRQYSMVAYLRRGEAYRKRGESRPTTPRSGWPCSSRGFVAAGSLPSRLS